MKKAVLLVVPLLLTACAANINHNVATVQGKTYLVETKNNNFFRLFQWSKPSTFKLIDGEKLDQEALQAYIDSVSKECKKTARIRSFNTSAPAEYDSEKFYDCMMDKLKK